MTRQSATGSEPTGGAIASVFAAEGYTLIDPPILQPADPFLDLSGEDIRRHIYVFTDPKGEELCLRPDLTIPACLHYLSDPGSKDGQPRRYAYEGLAFRCQEEGSEKPNEFTQAGVELIGEEPGVKTDAEVFGLMLGACQAAGLEDLSVTIGDIGLFTALIEALELPLHWRERLRRNFWQPDHFNALLERLAAPRERLEGITAVLARQQEEEARETVSGLLDLAGLDHIPGRSLASVAKRLQEKARDAASDPMSSETLRVIQTYLKIAGPADQALAHVKALTNDIGLSLGQALDEAERRLDAFADILGHQPRFATDFGRRFEYYTGMVFEITSKDAQIAGGGRYDDLLMRLGAEKRIPAVGAMVRLDRLAASLESGRVSQ